MSQTPGLNYQSPILGKATPKYKVSYKIPSQKIAQENNNKVYNMSPEQQLTKFSKYVADIDYDYDAIIKEKQMMMSPPIEKKQPLSRNQQYNSPVLPPIGKHAEQDFDTYRLHTETSVPEENANMVYNLQSISPSYNLNSLYDSRNLVNSNSLDNLKYQRSMMPKKQRLYKRMEQSYDKEQQFEEQRRQRLIQLRKQQRDHYAPHEHEEFQEFYRRYQYNKNIVKYQPVNIRRQLGNDLQDVKPIRQQPYKPSHLTPPRSNYIGLKQRLDNRGSDSSANAHLQKVKKDIKYQRHQPEINRSIAAKKRQKMQQYDQLTRAVYLHNQSDRAYIDTVSNQEINSPYKYRPSKVQKQIYKHYELEDDMYNTHESGVQEMFDMVDNSFLKKNEGYQAAYNRLKIQFKNEKVNLSPSQQHLRSSIVKKSPSQNDVQNQYYKLNNKKQIALGKNGRTRNESNMSHGSKGQPYKGGISHGQQSRQSQAQGINSHLDVFTQLPPINQFYPKSQMANYDDPNYDYPPTIEALHQSLDFTPSNKLTFGLESQALDSRRENSRNQTIRNEILDLQIASTPTPKHTPPKVPKKMLGDYEVKNKDFDPLKVPEVKQAQKEDEQLPAVPHIPNVKSEYKAMAYNDVVEYVNNNHQQDSRQRKMFRNRVLQPSNENDLVNKMQGGHRYL